VERTRNGWRVAAGKLGGLLLHLVLGDLRFVVLDGLVALRVLA
jgi:hypothetical protein